MINAGLGTARCGVWPSTAGGIPENETVKALASSASGMHASAARLAFAREVQIF